MARPRKGSEKIRPKHLGLRVEAWIYASVHRLASDQDRPASDVAHELLEIALGRLGIKREIAKVHITSRAGTCDKDG